MTHEELQAMMGKMMDESFDKKLAPILETQRKYADIFNNPQPKAEDKGEKLEPGIRFARCAKLNVIAKGDMEKALAIAKGTTGKDVNRAKAMYPDDLVLHEQIGKALGTTIPSDGGFLVPEVLAQEVIPLLYAKTVVMELGGRRVDMTNANLTIPRLSQGSTAYYEGENRPAPKSQQKFDALNLRSKKLFVLVPTSNDLIRNASVSADALIRDDMLRSTRLKMDYMGLYGPGTQYTPLGIKYTKNILSNSASAKIDQDDPVTMVSALKHNNIPMVSMGWAFNSIMEGALKNLKTTTGAYIYREEMNTGKLLGFPYLTTEQIPIGADDHGITDIFLGDWSEFILGEEVAFELSASTEAAYTDENNNIVSAFTNDQTVIKILSKHDMGVRHAPAFLVYSYYTK